MSLIGLATYPGLGSIAEISFTDVAGIQPAKANITFFPGTGTPASDGDLVLLYDSGFTLVIKDCHYDTTGVESGTGGNVLTATLWDERWQWQFVSITGRYNVRLPNNFVDPERERNPQQLAALCFDLLVGTGRYDVTALPLDARPEIDWDNANAAEALARLCDDLGCRIVPQRTRDEWVVVQTGVGAPLPEFPMEDDASGLERKQIPDYIKVVTAPALFQWGIPLEPVGRDTDMSWRTLDQLSYRLNNNPASAYGFGSDYKLQGSIDNTRILQPDGTHVSGQELALQTVFRCWRVKEDPNIGGVFCPWQINGSNVIRRKQLILSDQLASTCFDLYGRQHARPAFSFGEFYTELFGMLPFPTRVDFQGPVYRAGPEDRASFSMSLDPIDTDRSILSFSKPMLSWPLAAPFPTDCQLLFLMCAAQIRDRITWQPVRYEYYQQLGSGTDKSFCHTIVKDDIQPWYAVQYTVLNRAGNLVARFSNNETDVRRQCQSYAAAIAQTFQNIATRTRRYVGWFRCDLDGAISQVTYTSNGQGTTMTASLNTEHNFDIPTYRERRQRDGRQNLEQKLKRIEQIADRLARARGTGNI